MSVGLLRPQLLRHLQHRLLDVLADRDGCDPHLGGNVLLLGTPTLATRGLRTADFDELGAILSAALTPQYQERAGELAERVAAIVERYPLYEELAARAPA